MSWRSRVNMVGIAGAGAFLHMEIGWKGLHFVFVSKPLVRASGDLSLLDDTHDTNWLRAPLFFGAENIMTQYMRGMVRLLRTFLDTSPCDCEFRILVRLYMNSTSVCISLRVSRPAQETCCLLAYRSMCQQGDKIALHSVLAHNINIAKWSALKW